ncbi:MAG: hypothetical protein ACT4TC_11275 [Myxococcaceae bacterium]
MRPQPAGLYTQATWTPHARRGRPVLLRAACALLLLGLTGCFIPPGDDYFYNRPPVLIDVQPPEGILTLSSNTQDPCQVQLTLSAQVEDPDLDDRTYYRWFVDDVATTVEGALPVEKKLRRSILISWSFRPKYEPLLEKVGTHTIDLVVADGFLIGKKPEQDYVLPDGGVVFKLRDVRRWTLINQSSTVCAPLPDSPN